MCKNMMDVRSFSKAESKAGSDKLRIHKIKLWARKTVSLTAHNKAVSVTGCHGLPGQQLHQDPCSTLSSVASPIALHAEMLARRMGFGKSRQHHLHWNEIHWLEKGWKKYCSFAFFQSSLRWTALLVLGEETELAGGWVMTHIRYLHCMVLPGCRSAGYSSVFQPNA